MFTQNEGTLDRGARAIAGILLLVATFMGLSGLWQIIAGVAAVVLLATAIFGYCPLYAVLHIDTGASKPAAKS